MPLTFNADRVVDYPVRLKMLDPNNPGATLEHEFTARFRLLKKSEQRDWMRKLSDLSADLVGGNLRQALQSASRPETLAEYEADMKSRLIGWGEDLVQPDNAPLPFSEANRDALYEDHAIASALDRALWAASRDEPAKK